MSIDAEAEEQESAKSTQVGRTKHKNCSSSQSMVSEIWMYEAPSGTNTSTIHNYRLPPQTRREEMNQEAMDARNVKGNIS